MRLQLTDKDRKNLFIFLSIIVIACSFFFIYLPHTRTASEVKKEKEQLQVQLDEYISKEMLKPKLEEEIKQYEADNQKILKNYPEKITQEKALRILLDMEIECLVSIPRITFNAMQQFYPEQMMASTVEEGEDVVQEGLYGYKMDLEFSYESTYEAAKAMIDYFNNYADSISIRAITIGYNTETGNLSGDVKLSMYCVPNGGTPYIEPDFGDIPAGVENIFGGVRSDNVNLPIVNKTTDDKEDMKQENVSDKKANSKK